MADGFFPTLVSKDQNVNSQTNPLFSALTDGTDLALIDGSGNLQVLVNNGSGASAVNIQDGGNSITVDGTVAATQSGSWTVAATQSGSWTVTANAGTGTFQENVAEWGGSATSLGQKTMANSVPVVIASDQSAIPVSFAIASQTGEVSDYATATVAGSSTSNHDYTVVTSMKLTGVSFACSGGGKVELKTGPVASLVSKWVGFVPKQGGEVKMEFNPPITVPTTSTGTVRLVMTNRESSSQDLYSTIVGVDA